MTAPDPVAYFNNWQFSTNQTKFECPGMDNAACRPPNSACARDPNTGQQYCCDGPPSSGRVCWGFESPCKSDGSTINCTDGRRKFCCRSGFEKCSETQGQAAGICWSTHHDPLNNVTFSHLSSIHSSLSSRRPSATSLPFDLLSVVSATATAPFATASGPAQTASSTGAGGTSTPPPADPAESSSSGVSGAAIAGIVIGAVAGVALLGLAVFFLLRRRRRAAGHAYEAPPDGAAAAATAGAGEKHGGSPVEVPASAVTATTAAGRDGSFYGKPGVPPGGFYDSSQPPQELGADAHARSELPGQTPQPQELPASPVPTAGVSTMTTPSQYHPSPFTETRSLAP
ncbi:hypothetical protein RB595_004374 [Gaeumannomyces hyphopodioides]